MGFWNTSWCYIGHINQKHYTYSNTHTYANRRSLCCSDTNSFIINFWLRFFNTRRETILKSLSYHTMLTTLPNVRHISWSFRSQFIFAGRDPKNLTAAATVETQLYGRELHSLTQWQQLNCLPAWSLVNSQLTLFQNLQILRTIASGHDVIHTPALFPIWGLLWQLWLSYRLCACVKLYPMSVHLN